MIKITDNFLKQKQFENLQEYCKDEFKIVTVGGKQFSILETPEWVLKHLEIPEHELILTFIRNAYKGFDDEVRIHADNIINGCKTALAQVLYINNSKNITKNGTCFYDHINYGPELPKDISDADFNSLLTNDSNNALLWTKTDVITAKPNRLLTYNSNYFHSKWPASIEEGTRIVLVAFHVKKQKVWTTKT
ncbi:DUF6445 family protein [Flavobacterium psychrophilum]|uniref:Prolyl 4-hydroxylase alpha subunit Fe(2+) 2OG dioxygenase domain-containing protein n=1 Tax=Flavobacterium psychrophilum TaxID=96345 RepID=A0A7U2NE59_FLAPS|nr:DUF6445 family protein [Flavobacterium psychrophilum]QRE03526.1 hypothetical protein H0H26_11640 [Flavobacterium psychrophilum]